MYIELEDFIADCHIMTREQAWVICQQHSVELADFNEWIGIRDEVDTGELYYNFLQY
jgi:hypothetical protein